MTITYRDKFFAKKDVDILLCKTTVRLHLSNDLQTLRIFRHSHYRSRYTKRLTINPKIYFIQLRNGGILV